MSLVPGQVSSPSYGTILSSTAIIGASTIAGVLLGIIRMKALAVLLGPAGVGLFGLYGSVADLTQNLAGLGVQSSGVRQIAEAVGSGDTGRIARTAAVLRRVSVVLGLVGAMLLVGFAAPVASLTFGDSSHAGGIVLLSLAVFFRLVSAGQVALVQGMRRIRDLASLSILGPLAGTVITIPMVYLLGDAGIVPSLVAIAALSVLTSWWYSRKVRFPPVLLSPADVRYEAAALVRLGVAFMGSGLLTVGAAYAIRLIVLRRVGFEAAGLYQAAWAVGGLYVGIILQAMGTDFYPRLTETADDDAECNRLANEQAQVSILLAGPGVLATLTFAPLVISLFYTHEFAGAVPLLRWVCLGMMLRVIAWPIGFIVLAKGRQRIFLATEVAATAVHVGLAWYLVGHLGAEGAGAAFFGLYVFHTGMIYLVVRRLSGFRWSEANLRLGLVFVPGILIVFWLVEHLPPLLAAGAGSLSVIASGVYALRKFLTLLPPQTLGSALTAGRSYFLKANSRPPEKPAHAP